MSQVDELAPQYPRSADVAAEGARKHIDWTALIVMIALGATLAWIYFLFRVMVSAIRFVLL